MIIEFATALTFTLPSSAPDVTQVEFTAPVQRVITYPPVGELVRLSGDTLPDGTIQAFQEEFLPGHVYFGAFAVTKDFGFGYVTGANSIESARDIAIEECLKQGPICRIYAEIYPQGYEPLQAGEISLAPEAGNYYSDPSPEWGSYRAMAISEDGAYSVVWNYGSTAEAEAAALSDCTEYAISDLPNLRSMPCFLIPFK